MLLNKCYLITVSSSETIDDIAIKYNTTVDELVKLNPDINLYNLTEGQLICVPELSLPICPIGSIPYEIQQGDTLAEIATNFFTTDEAILLINPNIDPNNLSVGQVICIIEERPKAPNCPSLNVYVIEKGDTIYSIAAKFGITVEALLEVNPGIDSFNLIINNILCLPFTPTPYIIVINVLLKRLFVYYQGKLLKVYPIATGKPSTPTPLGNFYIFNKQVNPGGPFGTRWLGLSIPSYGIHGTNRPDSIGTAASNGCIRMFNNDVEELFSKLSVNTPVIIM